jgi:hypothetical protein
VQLFEKYRDRFRDLNQARGKIPFTRSSDGYGNYVAHGAWQGWATSALNIIQLAFGARSAHCVNFRTVYDKCGGDESEVRSLFQIFESAKEDFEMGFAGDVELRVSGEIFGDFVVLAKEALTNGHKNVAAVLACAALEDALKKFASINGVETHQKSMTEVINSLKSEGLVSGSQKSLLDVMPRIRNSALHADWDKIDLPDVNSVIGFVEQFLLTKFD